MRRLLTAFVLTLLCAVGQAQVVINELGIAPTTGSNEFIELYNKSNCTVDLSCYTLVFSSTSGGGNATGWTVKIPSGKSIAPCGYFLIGGIAGTAGVAGGTGYPTGGTVTSYPTADLNIGTLTFTVSGVYMKQSLAAGTLSNSSGQVTLLDNNGNVVSSVSYNSGNNAATYPLSSYLTCNTSGNIQGVNNITNPGASANNVNAAFAAAGNQGIYLNASGGYVSATSLTPGAANPSQIGCTPSIAIASSTPSVCYSSNTQTTTLAYTLTTNSPTHYSIIWNTTPANGFVAVTNAVLPASPITINIPAGTQPGTYTGNLTVSNATGTSCTSIPFIVTVNARPNVIVSPTSGIVCSNGGGVVLTASGASTYSWTPSTGLSATTGSTVTANPASNTSYTVTGTDANGCSNTATINITVSTAPSTPTYLLFPPTCVQPGGITITSPQGTGLTYSIDGVNYFNNGGIFSNVAPGNYSISVKNADGCVSTPVSITMPAPPGAPAAPTVSVTQTTCSNSTGSILVTNPPQGTGYEYSIDNVNWMNTPMFSNLAPGSYQVWVKNSSTGCISSGTQVIINAQPVTPTVSVNSPIICSNGSATITATPTPAGTYTYVWTIPTGAANPGNVSSFTATVGGSYSVTVTNANGCSGSGFGTLTVTTLPAVTADNKQVCENGTVTLTGTPAGGTWSGSNVSSNQFNATGLAPGNYTVTYSYTANGCSASATATVTVNALPSIPVFTVTQPNCTIGTGSISIISPTGAGIEYSIDGSTFQTANSFTGLVAGTYTLWVRNVSGCLSSVQVVINNAPGTPAAPTVSTTQPTCTTSTGSITVTAPLGLSYSIDGVNYQTSTSFVGLSPGTYSVTVQNGNGCISGAQTITINAAPQVPFPPTVTVVQPGCNTATGTININSPTGAGYSYNLNGGAYQTATSFTGLIPGTYTVGVQNASGCTSATINVTINAAPPVPAAPTITVSQPACTTPTGSITITAPLGAGMEYSIDGINFVSSTLFTGLTPNTYNVHVRNSNGCISTGITATINAAPSVPGIPILNVTQPNCTAQTGTIIVSSPIGSGIEYSIDGINFSASNSFTGLAAGNYTITVRNAQSCISTASTTINAAPVLPPIPTVTTTQPTCTQATGSITITSPVDAGLTYSINGSPYQVSSNFSGLLPGSYTIAVQNTNGCTSTSTAIVINAQPPTPATPTVSVLQPDCNTPTGIITITAPVGTGIEYSIDGINFQSSNGFSGLSPNSYTVVVRNASGCVSSSTSVAVNAPPITPTVTVNSPVICPGSIATMVATPSTAGAYSYGWTVPAGVTNPGNVASFSTNIAGTYTVTITNTSGCSGTGSGTVTITSLATVSADDKQVCVEGSVTLTGQPSGGVWSGANVTGNTFNATGLSQGNYTVTYTYTSGSCSGSANATITVVALPAPAVVNVIQPDCNNATGSITISSPTGAGYSYSINSGSSYQSLTNFAGLLPGNYQVVVMNASGCVSDVVSVFIQTQPPTPATPTVSVTQPTCTNPTGSINILSPTGTGLEYSIDGTTYQSNTTFTNLVPGNYNVTVRNSAGCVSPAYSVTINSVPSPPPAPIVTVTHPDCSVTTGTMTITFPTGAGLNYSIDGINYSNTSGVFSNLNPGSYNVTVRNQAGCISIVTVATINAVPQPPAVSVNSPVICPGAFATITATPSPAGNYSYTWTVPAGVTNPGNVASFTTNISGVYSVTIAQPNGCTASASGTLTINAIANVTADDKQVCTGSTVTLTGQPAGGIWSGTNVNGNQFDATGLSPGTYTITYTYTSGSCSGTANATITVNSLPVTPILYVTNHCDGTSTLTASNYTGSLTWSNGSTTNPLVVTAAGSYTVYQTVNGCNSGIASITANPAQSPSAPVVTITQQPDCNVATGSILINSPTGAALSYSIDGIDYSNTSGVFTGLIPGNYSVTARNGNCTSLATFIAINPAPDAPASPTVQVAQPTCLVNTGSITVTFPTGAGIEYSIDGTNYQASNVFNNLMIGSYGVSVRNAAGCLSSVITVNIIAPTGVVTTSATACITEGNTYNFNGQVLTSTGNYSTTYPRPGQCDSVVNLYLLVSRTVVDQYSGCGSYNYGGTVYTNSIILRDTLTSTLTGCDSIYHVVDITINPEPISTINVCLPAGQTYSFNGQLLTTSGQYAAVFNTVAGCDSTVNLTLVVTRNETVQVSGCTSVTYSGVTYTSNTTLTETIPSVITNCDSVVRTVNIVVISKPSITISSDKTICRGDSVLLTASSPNALINWIGVGPGNIIKVAPVVTTTYLAVATNASGCSDTARLTVHVNDFDAQLFANVNPVIAGKTVHLRTSANAAYQVLSWQPLNVVGGFTKSFVADTSLTVFVTTRSATGCIDIDSLRIVVDPLGDIYIPTAFTPNRDGKNDLFVIAGGEFKAFDLKIFNRWGQIVFQSKERSKGWDGRFEGKDAISGAYVYNLSCTLKNGKKIQRSGTVLLIR